MNGAAWKWAVTACAALYGGWAAGAQSLAGTDGLPPEDAVRAALAASPMVTAAHEAVASGEAQQRRRRVGPYEWEAAVLLQRRTDPAGLTYDEQQYELTRRLRLPGKAQLDRRLGEAERRVGGFTYEDAWHEAARGFLSRWIELLRQNRRTARIVEQQALVARLQETVRRRFEAGDAPRIDLQLAEAEQARLAARATEAAHAAEVARIELAAAFPSLDAALPERLEAPPGLEDSDAAWIARVTGHNHEVELAEGHAEAAALQATRASRDRVPDPSVGLQFSDNLDGNRRMLGVRIAIPLGYEGRDADAALARSTSRRATADAERVRLAVDAGARAAVLAVRSAQTRWERLQTARERAQSAADAAVRGYELGEGEIALMLAARRQSSEAVEEADLALVDLLEAHARLRLDAHQLWALDEPEH